MALIISTSAAADLDDIWLDVAEDCHSPARADDVVAAITRRFDALSAYPQLGRARDHDLRPGLRTLPVGNHIIIYGITDTNDVLIHYVLHGRRDIQHIVNEP